MGSGRDRRLPRAPRGRLTSAPLAADGLRVDDGRMSDNLTPGPDTTPPTEVPNPETGVGVGAGQPSTFEPEEDTEASPEPPPPGH